MKLDDSMYRTTARAQVYVEGAICGFFEVNSLDDIAPALLRKAKRWLARLPEKLYTVRLTFQSFGDTRVTVRHPSQVRKAAIRQVEMTDSGRRAHKIDMAEFREIT